MGTKNIELIKDKKIVSELILIDGTHRSGKSMIGPILASFDGVEIVRTEPIIEALPQLYKLKKIEKDAAVTLLQREIDMMLYNSMISRNINFRIKDRTGVWKNANTIEYFKRLFYKDGDVVLERIKSEKRIFQIEVHDILPVVDLYFETFGKGLRIIELVRHPIDLVHTQDGPSFSTCLQSNPRYWRLTFKSKNKAVPYYAYGWIDEFLDASPVNRAIKIIQRFSNKMRIKHESLSEAQKSQVLIIPFERFAISPYKYLDLISNFIGKGITKNTHKVLKKEKVPREINPKERERKMKLIKEKASKECLDMLDKLIYEYEQKYLN